MKSRNQFLQNPWNSESVTVRSCKISLGELHQPNIILYFDEATSLKIQSFEEEEFASGVEKSYPKGVEFHCADQLLKFEPINENFL